MNLVDELYAIAAAFHAAGVRYAICGGVALAIHGAVRATQDIDVLVAPADVDRAVAAVRPLGFEHVAAPISLDGGTERAHRVQSVAKLDDAEHILLDLVFADAAFAAALDDREEVALDTGPISVVSREALIGMKRLAGRHQDVADLDRLGAAG